MTGWPESIVGVRVSIITKEFQKKTNDHRRMMMQNVCVCMTMMMTMMTMMMMMMMYDSVLWC